MPLINCPECNSQISSLASSCPKCGLPKQYFNAFSSEDVEIVLNAEKQSKNESKKKRTRHKLPNGFGYIKHLSGNRSNSYAAYPPSTEMNNRGTPLYKNPIGYYKSYNEAYRAIVTYHEKGRANDKTFAEVYEMFIAEHKKNISESTISAYSASFKRCKPLHDKIIRNINAVEMQSLLDNNPRGYSSNIQLISVLRMVCEYADKNGYVDRNNALFLKNNKENDNELGIPFTEDNLRIMWKNRDRFEIKVILILCYTGLRIGELRITNIDLKEKLLQGGLKTEKGRTRVVPIIDDIIPLFKCIKEFRKLNAEEFRKQLNPVLKELNLYNVGSTHHTPHDARHTFNWLCDKNGVEEISKYMLIGHSLGSDVDKKVYTHRTIEELRKEIEKIEVIK